MKFKSSILLFAVIGLYLSSAVSVESRSRQGVDANEDINEVVASLITAKSAVDKINILDKDTDFVFDFTQKDIGNVVGKGGRLVFGKKDTFPAVVGLGVAMATGFVGPCGMNTPHIHPRATEFFYSVNGTFQTAFIAENGARQVKNIVYPNQATIFPQGSIHYQANLNCEAVQFISGLSSEDPGASQVAQNFFKISKEVTGATLAADTDTIEELSGNIPDNLALGIAECLKKCGYDTVPYY